MKHLIISLFLILSLQSCNTDDCGDCFTPPQPFLFELVDKSTGENAFTNGTYEPQQLNILDSITTAPVEYEFISENNVNLIQLNTIGWKTETVNLSFEISGNQIFNFYVDATRKKENCCSFTTYNAIELEGAEFEIAPNSGIHTILLN
ncbi:hypothetical protein ESY86_03795 [Subsaximicrobium wynnwilliamsii]|uniref:Uncharacterized protein n=1 Tax=Subsaximicrobium wynnwilliamsii TaxID=291179 RepID=A0A5C6ZJM0_9FLAO|nr:hypothetical protein [Subsaximicrobium wynnwilliamsii]TXD84827.1 hypothetical protein ESY87_03575 [Subsaximicrobium wynnwilliamsii]TXD90498.1 hypothetical protein ESY86_03795 [Subsaximicrobium wynnwilliamsii]TXE04973.1 hypothetical protein ESY88_02100 [Subsaximicrobium wynnwilliamsii]